MRKKPVDAAHTRTDVPVHVQRALRDERKVQRGAPDGAQRVRHDAMRRSTREARKAVRFAAYRFASAVRVRGPSPTRPL
jgi:hypothetical protein